MDWVAALGVPVLAGRQVVDVVDNVDTVTAVLADGDAVSGEYLIGCDGGRSTIRQSCGICFQGTDPTMTGRSAIVDIVNPVDSDPLSRLLGACSAGRCSPERSGRIRRRAARSE